MEDEPLLPITNKIKGRWIGATPTNSTVWSPISSPSCLHSRREEGYETHQQDIVGTQGANPRPKHREGELAPPSCASISLLHFYLWKRQASFVFSVPSTLSILTNEYLVVMAGSPSRVKEELKMSTSEDLGTGNITQNQEQPVMPGENLL